MPIARSTRSRALAGRLALAALLLPAALARADESLGDARRAGRWELFGVGVVRHEGPTKFDTDSGEVTIHTQNSGMGGFGAAYNFTDQFALRFDTRLGDTASHGHGLQEGGHSDVFLNDGRVNLEWNFLRGRVTPYVTGGIGFQYVEIELENANPVPVCYWDPWYGYYCGFAKPVFSETDFAWNTGVGLRWDVNDHLVLRAALDAGWVDYQDSKAPTGLINGVFTVGWMF